MADNDQILQALTSINNRLDEQGKELRGMNNRLGGLEKGQQEQGAAIVRLEQGQEKTNTILSHHSAVLAHHSTALEALGAGVQDIREHMATKDGVDIVVEGAKIELKADIFASIAPMTRKVISHDRRIETIEKEKDIPNVDKH